MKITLSKELQQAMPELGIFFEELPVTNLTSDLDTADLKELLILRLNRTEQAQYARFRELVAGKTLLAVERLRQFSSPDDLPSPDSITALVIKHSYYTQIPITVFCSDSFTQVVLRYSREGEALEHDKFHEIIPSDSVIADTDRGILGIFGIKSADLGKITGSSKSLVVLSFDVSSTTRNKSRELVKLTSHRLRQSMQLPNNQL